MILAWVWAFKNGWSKDSLTLKQSGRFASLNHNIYIAEFAINAAPTPVDVDHAAHDDAPTLGKHWITVYSIHRRLGAKGSYLPL